MGFPKLYTLENVPACSAFLNVLILDVYLKTTVFEMVLTIVDIILQVWSIIILCHLYEHIEAIAANLHNGDIVLCIFCTTCFLYRYLQRLLVILKK